MVLSGDGAIGYAGSCGSTPQPLVTTGERVSFPQGNVFSRGNGPILGNRKDPVLIRPDAQPARGPGHHSTPGRP